MSSIVLTNSCLSAKILTWGASLADLRLDGVPQPLVVGLNNAADYEQDGNYLGAVIGRYGNRIRGGTTQVGGQELSLERNDAGLHHLHGGSAGFARRHWTIFDQGATRLELMLHSPDGDAHYPGTMDVSAVYEIIEPACLSLTIRAVCDKSTPVNLCHHPYFSLAGASGGHMLQIPATSYLPSGHDLIPLSRPEPVFGTKFDFTDFGLVGQHAGGRSCFNNTYCLERSGDAAPVLAARLQGARVEMELWTTQPGLHLYDAYKLHSAYAGHDGSVVLPARSVCLEAQAWPDAPNRPNFPDAILNPGQVYERTTQYRFALLP